MFIALAEKNEVVLRHLKHYIAFAPVTRITHLDSPGIKLAEKLGLIYYYELMHINEVFPWKNNTG